LHARQIFVDFVEQLGRAILVADVVAGVSYNPSASRFVVMPVAYAEALCRAHCHYWFSVPTRTEKGTRSHSFPINLNFAEKEKTHTAHHERMRRNLLPFEEKWSVLSEPIEKLHDPAAWQLL
jgi:hypothetical protein